jgi:hypothetical protein
MTCTAATNRVINSKIFKQCIIESGTFIDDPEGFAKELLDEVKSDFPVETALFKKSGYKYENDFVKAIFEYIKPILDQAQVAVIIILNA